MLSKKARFLLSVAFQLGIILLVIIFKLVIVTGGTTVFLRVQPVDPVDPLRGRYMVVSYDISRVYTYGESLTNGQTVYVPLEKRGKYWTHTYNTVETTPPASGLFIKGEIVSGAEVVVDQNPGYYEYGRYVSVRYGIEDYFIPETTDTSDFWRKEVLAEVAINPRTGNAVLKRLFVDNKPWP